MFRLKGSGVEAEVPRLIEAMEAQDKELASVLEKHMMLLVGLKNDNERRIARMDFNNAVKADLIEMAKEAE